MAGKKGPLSGQWQHDGSGLVLTLDRPYPGDAKAPFKVPEVPTSLAEAFSSDYKLIGGWANDLGGATTVHFKNGELTLEFPAYDDGFAPDDPMAVTSLKVTCVRRK
ncbi:hypothetical protein [Kitasatospora sp. NPDC001132]